MVPVGTTPLTEATDAESVTGSPTDTGFGVALSVTWDANWVVPAVDSKAPIAGGIGRTKLFASVVRLARNTPAPNIWLEELGMKL
jgi:hypothetical protein